MLKIHTATISVHLYLVSGRSSSCALPSSSPTCDLFFNTLNQKLKISQCSIEVVSLGPQVLDDFGATPTASILPAAVWTKKGPQTFRRKEVTLMKFALKASGANQSQKHPGGLFSRVWVHDFI